MFHHRDRDSSAGFSTGLLAGAVVGAGLALLFAPKSGTELRDDISESVNSLRDAIGDRYRDLAERAGVELDNIQERVDRAAEQIESSARAVVETAAQRARRENT
ncbi:MAG: YtxH domain-containing protein [Acidobacteria bacterium]|nr:YtxH domain-containing protein [Acidobacteriota bacterium]